MITTARHTAPERQTFGEMLGDVASLVGFIPQAGPPPFVAVGALVFGALMLAGPFAFAVVLVVAIALAVLSVALLISAVVAIVAAPYVLVQRAHGYLASHPFRLAGHRARAAAPVVVRREPVA